MADVGDLYAESIPDDTPADIEMAEESGIPVVEIDSALPAFATETGAADNGDALPFQDEAFIEDVPARVTYVDYLKSPVVSLLVGQGDEQALLTAHQALLTKSPWFEEACAKFSTDISVSFLHSL